MQQTRTNCCSSHCMAQECVGVRHVVRLSVVRSLTLCSSPCCSFQCVSPVSFFFHLNLELNPFLHLVITGAVYRGHSTNEESGPLAENTPFHKLWAQHPWRLSILRDHWNLPPRTFHRHDGLVRGTQLRDHRQSALFTTVHAGARKPADGKQACWRKFVASSILVSVSCKNGETRAWT